MRKGVGMNKRPAESAGVAGAIVALGAYVAGVRDPEVLAGATVVVGLVPAAVTLLVSNGGVVGLVRLVLHGRAR